MTSDPKDTLFKKPIEHISKFSFDDSVAPVFTDMINRSVPGYAAIIELLGTITHCFARTDHRYYDLGCSLGTSMLAMGQRLNKRNATVIGIDNSMAMLKKAQPIIEGSKQYKNTAPKYQLICADITDIQIQ